MALGIPLKLLHESEGFIITVELKIGDIYRGYLTEAEDNMNLQLQNVTMTAKNGQISTLEEVYIRGSLVKFIIVPDMLKNAPMFRVPTEGRGKGLGPIRGRGRGGGRGRGSVGRGSVFNQKTQRGRK
ncbi:small nuclear ribonucleoprotein sm d3 [Anaeramoeba ignava]|uniref:Small nuclear ribonucleoprotein Sm D3 n=1 Tax=Anaeramoeba ignava TaxID=1746090 RepID=A0A9Q0LNF7_ANAIG|nr:small nuclear ribonucleoprotein sm d3 [Anaeramoeba ignava]|eukprot:Anaeramoba_ignava/a352780_63.p1 GENE.a352780_63~~a352780_63.p1  ORF type:complete len:127 (-),score=26.70 a352780_63:235-615(-)